MPAVDGARARRTRLVPPIYFAIALAAMFALDAALPLARPIPARAAYAGYLLCAAGFGISFWGGSQLFRAGTPLRPFEESTTLVTRGLYRISRNPIYLGLVLLLTGTALAMRAVTPLAVPPLLIMALQRSFIRHEERALEERFGEEYRCYKRRVRRWI